MVQTTLAELCPHGTLRLPACAVNYEGLAPIGFAVPLGDGFFDFAAFFAGLCGRLRWVRGLRDVFAPAWWRKRGQPRRHGRQSLAFLRKLVEPEG